MQNVLKPFLIAATLAATSLTTTATAMEITADSFDCIRDMTHVRDLYVGNLLGNTEASVAIAKANQGGSYPEGTLLQLVPSEAMVKREKGFSPETNDWEFFELDVSEKGTSIRVRGTDKVINQFGGNCLDCHKKAEPKWDLVCEKGHGCDPLPFTHAMTTAIQKTDPRCEPAALSKEEKEALQYLFGG